MRVAVLNRGEAAVRFLATAAEHTARGDLTSIALHITTERDALFVRRADEAVDLESFPPSDPQATRSPYLDHDRLLAALTACRADMVWPGWGFVAEDAEFAARCEAAGITFIGPGSAAMRLLGDKVSAKQLAASAEVPVLPWSGGPVGGVAEAREHAERIGYPLMVKSAAGGGGMGIRTVDAAEELDEAWRAVRHAARRAFGDDTVFLERQQLVGRHLEVQVLADGAGTVWTLGVRECSVQRRRQKVLEESAPARLDAALEARLRKYAVAICRAAGYRNAGTVEFLVDDAAGEAYFMEVNTRLQVEHTVTEATTGIDLVAHQVRIAAGDELVGPGPDPRGHAIEVRLNAEDPDHGFAPAPGRVAVFRAPGGPGIRVDAGVEEHSVVSADFDPTIAKIVVWGADRAAALRRLQRALNDTEVLVADGATNLAFLRWLSRHPDLARGDVHTRWLDGLVADGSRPWSAHGATALVLAGIESFRRRERSLSAPGHDGHAADDHGVPTFRCELDGAAHVLAVEETGPGRQRVRIDDRIEVDVRLEVAQGVRRTLRIGDRCHHGAVVAGDHGFDVDVDGNAHRIGTGDGGVVRPAFPGMVVRVEVDEGQRVVSGAALATVESMKLESKVLAPTDGIVRDLQVSAGSSVGIDTQLLRIEPDRDVGRPSTGPLDLDSLPTAGAAPPAFDTARALVLGLVVPDDDLAASFAAALTGRTLDQRRAESAFLDLYCEMNASGPDGAEVTEAALAHLRTGGGADAADDTLHRHRIHRSRARRPRIEPLLIAVLRYWMHDTPAEMDAIDGRRVLDRLIDLTGEHSSTVADLARAVRSRLVLEPALENRRRTAAQRLDALLLDTAALSTADPVRRLDAASTLARETPPWESWLPAWVEGRADPAWEVVLTLAVANTYRHRDLAVVSVLDGAEPTILFVERGVTTPLAVLAIAATGTTALDAPPAVAELIAEHGAREQVLVEVVAPAPGPHLPAPYGFAPAGHVAISTLPADAADRVRRTVHTITGDEVIEQPLTRYLHPAARERLELWRLGEFKLAGVDCPEGSWLFEGTSRVDGRDRRLFALAEVDELHPTVDDAGVVISVPELELALTRGLDSIRHHEAVLGPRSPYGWHRVIVYVHPLWRFDLHAVRVVAERVAHASRGLSLDQVAIHLHRRPEDGGDAVIHLVLRPDTGIQIGVKTASEGRVRTLTGYRRSAAQLQRRGLTHPWSIVRLLTSPGALHSDLPAGEFEELDLVDGRLEPVRREPGTQEAGVVIGRIANVTAAYPEGLRRVVVLNDPSRGMASLGEPECARISAAIALAARDELPLDWFAVSSGARVSMSSGTENLDATASVLRAIVESGQAGHEINVVLTGVNVGAQSYWDAEATMLMHTRGALIAVADHAMVLTGKEALDASGAVSAATNADIGGYETIMGPNGEAQYHAQSIEQACQLLLRHHEFCYTAPGEVWPRRRPTIDPVDRSVRDAPHRPVPGSDFDRVGDIVDPERNPDRKKPFDIRSVISAVADQDGAYLERWADMRDAENAVVRHAHIGGIATTVVGIESHELPRTDPAPGDGPGRWSAGTLFPRSSKKVARALNAASGVHPVVVLANLSGFDGSPESMREWQLEHGAEIGRAVVNFRGPLVFCVLSRYHGGAFVVFSKALNGRLEVIALEGARASVLGGAPAAAVVFGREVARRAAADPRVVEAREGLARAGLTEQDHGQGRLEAVETAVRSELRGVIGREFDAVHTIERARELGSVDRVIGIDDLRPAVIDALERGQAAGRY